MRGSRLLALALAALLLALPLAACGKRGPPQPPTNEPQTYPGKYPSE